MATIDFAVQQRLTPEDQTQPIITPRAWIWHTHGAPGTPADIGRYFDKESVHVESHGSTGFDGSAYQFLDTARRADANGSANGFAIAWENEDGGNPARPFTPAQVAKNARLAAWAALVHRIPLNVIDSATGSGHGWHSKYQAWNPNLHGCPGDVRERQVVDEILPTARAILKTLTSAPLPNLVVPPQLDPALVMPSPMASWCIGPHGIGVLWVTPRGEVGAIGTASYGGPAGRPYWGSRTASRIVLVTAVDLVRAGKVYTVISTAGERYHYPEG